MQFNNYNNLLETSDLENFHSSLDKPNGYTFNQLVNILADEDVSYEIVDGFDKDSKDKEIKEFNKITIKFDKKNQSKWEKVCKDYSLYEAFNIKHNKDTYIIKA